MPGCAMLMGPNKDKTAVRGCYCLDEMAVCLCKVLVIQQSCVVRPLLSNGLF